MGEMAVRKSYLDIIRLAACLLVIIMHSPMEGASGMLQNAIYTFTAPCIGLFFMVSGALLLPAEGGISFLRKRFSKVLVPTILWSLFYIGANVVFKRQDISAIPKQILSVPFSPQGHNVLWFMYTLCGLYILAPVISPWLKSASRKEIEIILFVWGITLLYPVFEGFLDISESTSAPLYYFTGYAGYFLLGYYFTRFEVSWGPARIFLVAVVALACLAAIRFLPLGIRFEKAIGYLSIFAVMLTMAYFSALEKIGRMITPESSSGKILAVLSGLSFGVYLVHIFFIRYLLYGFIPGGVKQVVCTVAITVTISFLCVWLISFLPISQYIIGYKWPKRSSTNK